MIDFGVWQGRLGPVIRLRPRRQAGVRRKEPFRLLRENSNFVRAVPALKPRHPTRLSIWLIGIRDAPQGDELGCVG